MPYRYNWDVKNHAGYRILKPLGTVAMHLVYNVHVTGKENIPESGAFILACNHVYSADPVILTLCSGRECHFMAKSEFFESKLIGAFLSSLNAFPVRRGLSNSLAFNYARELLADGEVVGIFPEGTRNMNDNRPRTAKTGAVRLAMMSGADILPACLYYANQRRSSRYVGVSYGKPIKTETLFEEGDTSPAAVHSAADRMMDEIKCLWLAEEQRFLK